MAPRYVRIAPQAPTGADDDLGTALQSLAPAGALAKGAGKLSGNTDLGNAGTGLAGLLSLTRGIAKGDPGQAVGGAANVGSGLAGLADYPGVADTLGAVGGPLTLATGLASGDPLSSTLGGLQTASLASGYLGGPTLGSLATEGLAAAGLDSATLAAMGGLGGLSVALAPAALTLLLGSVDFKGAGLDDMLFGGYKPIEQRQLEEYKRYAADFPGLAARRTAGAKTFDTLGDMDTPDEISQSLATAASGAHANVEPAAWNVGHTPHRLKFDAPDMSSWNAASPELGGHNQAAFLGLMDKGQAAGLDTGGMTGDWNLGQWVPFDQNGRMEYTPLGPNTTGSDYRTRLGLNEVGDPAQTQEAQDLGNAVSGMARHLGVDLRSKGEGDYENFNPDQLAGYGFTPGNYGLASLNYLRSFDPNVSQNPEWASYASALDPNNALADLDPLTLTPRKRASLATPYSEFNLGSGGGTA